MDRLPTFVAENLPPDPISLFVIFIFLALSSFLYYDFFIRIRVFLKPEQIRLHAELVGDLANLVFAGGFVFVLVEVTPKLTTEKLLKIDVVEIYGDAMVVFGSATAWLLLHLYSISLLGDGFVAGMFKAPGPNIGATGPGPSLTWRLWRRIWDGV